MKSRIKKYSGALVALTLVLFTGVAIAGGRDFLEQRHIVEATSYGTDVAGGEDYVSLKNWAHCTIMITGTNIGTATTGAVVTVKQATAVAGTGEKELAFSRAYVNTNTVVSDAFVLYTPASSITNAAGGGNQWITVIDIEAEDLDTANSFDCVRVDVTGSSQQQFGGIYILSAGRYMGGTPSVSAITD